MTDIRRKAEEVEVDLTAVTLERMLVSDEWLSTLGASPNRIHLKLQHFLSHLLALTCFAQRQRSTLIGIAWVSIAGVGQNKFV